MLNIRSTDKRVVWGSRHRHGQRLGAFSLLLLLLTGCAAAPVAQLLSQQLMARRQVSAPVAVGEIELSDASTNRLLVTGTDGNLFTVSPNGSGRFNLTTDSSSNRAYTQPTWSSTGERIGWAAIERRSDEVVSTLVTSQADGQAQTLTQTLFPPFYLYWSPDDQQLAYLSSWMIDGSPTIALQSVDMASGGTDSNLLGTGEPFYFSWAPSGEQLIAHIDNQQLVLIDTAATEPTVLEEGPANFAAPQWIGATDQFLYVTADESTAQLVLADNKGSAPERLTYLTRQDQISFGLNATGSQIAYIETSEAVGFNAFGPLFLYDRAAETFEQLSTTPVIAFFWSPDGSSLFFLTAEPGPDLPWLRVNVWNGTTVRQFARFIPSATFLRNYLPFADQYRHSLRFWSPDSQSIVYAGQAEDGTAGIWVQDVTGEAAPELVAEGTFATWSPR